MVRAHLVIMYSSDKAANFIWTHPALILPTGVPGYLCRQGFDMISTHVRSFSWNRFSVILILRFRLSQFYILTQSYLNKKSQEKKHRSSLTIKVFSIYEKNLQQLEIPRFRVTMDGQANCRGMDQTQLRLSMLTQQVQFPSRSHVLHLTTITCHASKSGPRMSIWCLLVAVGTCCTE